jgi:nicotinate-nucleotide adenylyltransferase
VATAGLRSIGILGGTFSPPHLGHLALARHAKSELDLELVVLMAAHSASHKRVEDDPGPIERLRMCRLAVGDEAGLAVCGLEVERGGPSYTVDTLRAIHASHAEVELTFIVGADMARTMPRWREPQALLELASLAVAEREDGRREDVLAALAPLQARMTFLEMGMVEISSSLVRERVAAGEPVGELVGPAVAAYIAEHGLYRATSATEPNTNKHTKAKAGAQ